MPDIKPKTVGQQQRRISTPISIKENASNGQNKGWAKWQEEGFNQDSTFVFITLFWFYVADLPVLKHGTV